MADVTLTVQDQIDWLLAAVRAEWCDALDVAEHWEDLDSYERSVFVAEWSIPRDYLLQLHQHVLQDHLSAEQKQRFDALVRFMAEHTQKLSSVIGPEMVIPESLLADTPT